MNTLNLVFVPFFLALVITIILVPLTLIFIKKIGLFDDPKQHKHPAIIHKKPIPRGGGIPFFFGILITSLFILPLTNTTIVLLVAGCIALVIGVLDDKLDISPYFRFLANFGTAFVIIASGVSIAFITNPSGGILSLDAYKASFFFFGYHLVVAFSDIVALIWLVWVMNMLNWSKGVDGQMPGIVAISAIVIGFLSLRFPLVEQNTLIATKLSFIIAGASLGFLFFNFYPAKIFPGYGATSVYLLLGAVSILSGAKLATAILVMGVPMVDGGFTILRRILTGRSPFWHDNKHLHHLLLRFGFSQRYIALFYWLISAILGSISLLLSSRGKIFAIVMLIVIVGGGLLFLHFALRKNEKNSI